jgi:hypothetical protein
MFAILSLTCDLLAALRSEKFSKAKENTFSLLCRREVSFKSLSISVLNKLTEVKFNRVERFYVLLSALNISSCWLP